MKNIEEVKENIFNLDDSMERACSYFEIINIDCKPKEKNNEFYSINTK